MKPKRNLIQICLLCAAMLPATLQAEFRFVTNNNAITITGYYGPGGAVTIPGTIHGYPVTTIGMRAFYFNGYSLTSVTIPDSVTSIEDDAFHGCSSLTNVTIGNSVASIGSSAFYFCSSLTNVTIPNSVTNIGILAFASCASQTAITVDVLNSVYSSVDGVLFNKGRTTLIQYPGGKAGGYTIPTSVTSIWEEAFFFCSGLTSATIPNSVTTIDFGAFAYCTNLTNVTIGSSVPSIGGSAFYSCSSLTGVYFTGNSPTPTNDLSVFRYANNTTVYYLPGATGWGSTFDGCQTALWFLPNPLILNQSPSFGVKSNQFGFTIVWATNIPVVVEACTDFACPNWCPVATNTLTGGTSYFSDPLWTNSPVHFYRLRSP